MISSKDISKLKVHWINHLHGTVRACKKQTESVKDCMDCGRFYGYFDGKRMRNVPITISGHKRYMAVEVSCLKSKVRK